MMKSKEYYGIVIKESIVDNDLSEKIKSLSINTYPHKLNGVLDTTIYKLKLNETLVDKISAEISKNLLPNKYYVHFVSGSDMIVVYPNKIYKFNSDEGDIINECKEYGEYIGIDKSMMKFNEMFKKDHPNEKNAIVFGGSGDLGLAFCKFFENEGYKVYSSYRNNKIIESKYEQLNGNIKNSQDIANENIAFFKKR